jgi:hypothetical protein
MAEIKVSLVKDERDLMQFQVVVCDGATKTEHMVKLTEDVYRDLTDGMVSANELVKKSFEFLLHREPKESILREFDLTVISRYFPEYKNRIKNHILLGEEKWPLDTRIFKNRGRT